MYQRRKIDQRRKMRARSKSSRASVRPLDNFLLEMTSASRVAASSASRRCRNVRSEFSSALVHSKLVAIPSMRALVAPCCVSKRSRVFCADPCSFSALVSSVLLFSKSVFVVSSSFFEAFDSIFDSSSLVVRPRISWSAFAVVSRRSTPTSVKVLWGGGRCGAWVKVMLAGPKVKGLGSITGRSGRDAGGGWLNVFVVGPKVKDCGGTGVEAEIG